MKRILLPTDFSENAYNAVKYAVQFLKNEVCEFYLLHTYTPAIVSSASILDSYSALTLQKATQNKAQLMLDELKEKIREEFPNDKHSFISIASFNLLIAEMRILIVERSIDYVIMGTQGATGAKEVFLGTQTMYAIKKLKCPVLAVPAKFQYETPQEILFPTDYKLDTNNIYLSMLRELCDQHVSRLHILNSYYGTPLTEEQLDNKAFLDAYFIDNAHLFHIAEDLDVLGAVRQFQTRAKINFMVMFHNKHNFLENMLFKPVINQVVYHTNVPFLVIPAVKRQ
ncbi:universal stress protein [Ulvibacter antarcticus]|uniref:Nucleotide-binding universal stress UspA family protein n=1 Tax=Ulvibacter antarcticus TaxID=442714 RepID=A0A3L9YDJ1_9FLAO|nr:universal stress protein [Ulvibacter antarcticus]RMA58766.1 nucleotide-binding universal stress UspA family protein [Ulvibacter antarcticus]